MEQKDNRRDTVRKRSSDSATQRRNKNRNYNNANSRERAKRNSDNGKDRTSREQRNSDYGKDRTSRERSKSARYSDREITRQRKSQNESVAEKRRQRDYKVDNLDYSYKESPFFSKSTVSGNINMRTNRADDFFENKDYKPWDTEDEFNRSTTKTDSIDEKPRVKKRLPTNVSKLDYLKSGMGRVSKRVLVSSGSDENDCDDEQELDPITESIRNSRNNKRLLNELNSKKKPLSKKQRKFKNVFMAVSVAIGVLVIGLVLSLTVLFRCEKIIVEGVTRYDERAIISASSLDYGQNIFLTDRARSSEKIEEKYPYIEEAEIHLSIPNALKIKVTEAIPKYYIQDGTRYYIISKNSKLLEEVIERDQDIPTIIGCKLKNPKVGETVDVENSKVITVLNEIADSMTANAVTGIKEINLSDMSNIELNYENRITIVIGMPDDINYKIRTAMTIIYTKLSEADNGRLNCSNLVEGRTDGKANQSSFRPNNLIIEDTTEPATEPPTLPIVQSSTEPQTEAINTENDSHLDETYSDDTVDEDTDETITDDYSEENYIDDTAEYSDEYSSEDE